MSAGTYNGLRMCVDDEDFFEIDLQSGDQITVDLAFSNIEGDIDLALLDPDGLLVTYSTSGDNDEQVSFVVDSSGAWFIWVDLYEELGAAEGNDYGMVITVN